MRSNERERKRWAKEGEPSAMRFVGQIGVLGWIIVMLTLIGLFIGRWLDHKLGTGIFWSAPLLLVGVVIGYWSAWPGCIGMDEFVCHRTRPAFARPRCRRLVRHRSTHRRLPLHDAAMECAHVRDRRIALPGLDGFNSFASRLLPACLPLSPAGSARCRCSPPPPASWRRGPRSFGWEFGR